MEKVIHAVRIQQGHIEKMKAAKLKKGDRVSFMSRGGKVMVGNIEKVNKTTANVMVDNMSNGVKMSWRVNSSLLNVID